MASPRQFGKSGFGFGPTAVEVVGAQPRVATLPPHPHVLVKSAQTVENKRDDLPRAARECGKSAQAVGNGRHRSVELMRQSDGGPTYCSVLGMGTPPHLFS